MLKEPCRKTMSVKRASHTIIPPHTHTHTLRSTLSQVPVDKDCAVVLSCAVADGQIHPARREPQLTSHYSINRLTLSTPFTFPPSVAVFSSTYSHLSLALFHSVLPNYLNSLFRAIKCRTGAMKPPPLYFISRNRGACNPHLLFHCSTEG